MVKIQVEIAGEGADEGTVAGEVVVSSTVKDITAGAGLVLEDKCEKELKGVPGSWRLYLAR